MLTKGARSVNLGEESRITSLKLVGFRLQIDHVFPLVRSFAFEREP